MDDYKKEYLDTCDTINKKIIEKWPNITDGALAWAEEGAPDLYKQEEKLDARINVMWTRGLSLFTDEAERSRRTGAVPDPTFADFKKTVIEWARTILKIYKKYSESIEPASMLSESASLLGGSEKP